MSLYTTAPTLMFYTPLGMLIKKNKIASGL